MQPRTLLSISLAFALLLGAAGVAAAGPKGNKGNGNRDSAAAEATCVVDGDVVHGENLPGDELINFMLTDDAGTTGWVLGHNAEGWWNVTVPDRTGWTTYEFVSRTWGPNGSKYNVFASCSAGV